MRHLLTLIIGILIGIAIHWYITQGHPGLASSPTHTELTATGATNNESVNRVASKFDSESIKAELAQTGKVIREKSEQAGQALSKAADNARITATIKAKLVQDSGLAAFKIDVDTTDHVVTLSGTVSSPDQIARAMQLALETDGVQKVVSTLQIKA